MNLEEMKIIVRRDFHDEEPEQYRWTDEEIERHIHHAVRDFSLAVPFEDTFVTPTTAGSRDIDISGLTGRTGVEAVEYPLGKLPARFRRFRVWGDILTMLEADVPDGSDACIYYGKLHSIDGSASTIPPACEDAVITGACGYAVVEWAVYAVNRVNAGGTSTPEELMKWGREKLVEFRRELKKLGSKNRVRISALYRPEYPPVSQSTDYGP